MKILGVALDLQAKTELKKETEDITNEIKFIDSQETMYEEVKTGKYNAVLIDEDIAPFLELEKIMEKLNEIKKKTMVIIIGESVTLKVVAGMIKAGAYDYILKPIDGNNIIKLIDKAIKSQKMRAEKVDSKDIMLVPEEEIIGSTFQMLEIYKLIGKVSVSDVSVFIKGESGTGKELIAKEIHKLSNRASKPFITFNCSGMSPDVMERELFGYDKGTFSDAFISKLGKFEEANGGTLLLDEIGELEMSLQAKLLKTLQEGYFYRIGSHNPIKIDFRVIVTASHDLEEMIAEGKFRDELYHKIKVVEIEVPPLRERKDDITILMDYFMKQYNEELGKDIKGFSKPAVNKMVKYDWPGNVRELRNSVKSAMVVCRGNSIVVEDLSSNIVGQKISKRHGDLQDWVLADWIEGEIEILNTNNKKNYYGNIIYRVERELIRQVLEATNGKKVETAEILGITRNTLRAKMNAYGLE